MSKELPFFKFNATQWLTGNINYETFETQGAFIRLCAEYWNRSNEMTYEDAILRINNTKLVDYLIEKEYIKVKNKKVFIKFLDEEKIDIGAKRLKLSEAGRKGGLSSAEARLKGGSSIIEEDKEKDKEEDKNIPTLDEFVAYGIKQLPDVNTEALRLKYSSWVESNWIVTVGGKTRPIKNWKSTLNNTLPYLPKMITQPIDPLVLEMKRQRQMYGLE
jgi:hypothetical protein